jgi:hypothetical protein
MRGRPRKVVSTGEASALPVAVEPAQEVKVPAHHREHPDKISGEALRSLAHRRGIPKSELETMTDDKIRMQIKYIDYRRAHEDELV